jgi:peptidoglycan/xylan/chitin deacetylase (PgdA/CDA1 family)
MSKGSLAFLLTLAAFAGCSNTGSPALTGGQSQTAGSVPDTGGLAKTGGTTGVGGAPATGGTTATGGSSATGGTTNSVGTTAAGGKAGGTGGTVVTGGIAVTGGVSTTGGSSAGGIVATGGVTTTGGRMSTGGVDGGANDASPRQDVNGTGGTTTGGVTAKGGTTTPQGGSVAGSFKCNNLALAPATTGKAKPAGAAGGLKILDWAGFQGAVSFTFDDGNSSQISNYSKLQATGARVTYFLVTSWSNATNAIWKTAITDGHEIGNHTKSHSSTASLEDLQAAEDSLKTNPGFVAFTMAAPNGANGWVSVAPNILIANRGVSNGLVGPRDNTDPFSLPAYIPPQAASSSAMDSEVNAAKTGNKWKIFCIHGFTGDGSAYQPLDVTATTTTMSNAVKNGLWTESMGNVAAYWLGQKAISATATTSATWTLPAHFPPNMCVRATTTGGTVKQNGAEVPWNDHGYYEISLDAKSLTIE